MIYTDTDGCMILLADIQERNESVMYFLQLLCILFVCIFQMLEGACGIHVVARVDADLFRILRGNVCYFTVPLVEMPAPRCTCTVPTDEIRSGVSYQYIECESGLFIATPLIVTLRRAFLQT